MVDEIVERQAHHGVADDGGLDDEQGVVDEQFVVVGVEAGAQGAAQQACP